GGVSGRRVGVVSGHRPDLRAGRNPGLHHTRPTEPPATAPRPPTGRPEKPKSTPAFGRNYRREAAPRRAAWGAVGSSVHSTAGRPGGMSKPRAYRPTLQPMEERVALSLSFTSFLHSIFPFISSGKSNSILPFVKNKSTTPARPHTAVAGHS